jgi:prolyl-tRNA editing enzyme YbaK/EbsC (Cys-tRNA(Pro) deacylase)
MMILKIDDQMMIVIVQLLLHQLATNAIHYASIHHVDTVYILKTLVVVVEIEKLKYAVVVIWLNHHMIDDRKLVLLRRHR